MLTALRGVYENGTVHLMESAPPSSVPVDVVVVFLETNAPYNSVEVKMAAADSAQIIPRNEHMARLRESWQRAQALAVGMTGLPLSEEVLADRQEDH